MAARRHALDLGQSIDITRIHKLYNKLEQALEKSTRFSVKLAGVNRVDTSGIQLLLAFKREVLLRDGEIRWLKPSENFLQAASLLGVTAEFQSS